MALRDQPYLPLYIQDIMTDEKLNECSAATHGVYIKGIMCLMHKAEVYGKLLLRQKYKQNPSKEFCFATMLANHLPYTFDTILAAVTELIQEGVCHFEGDYLVQKRMAHDGQVSISRSKTGSKGGKKTKEKFKEFALAKPEAKLQQNTENENENNIVSNTSSNKEFIEEVKSNGQYNDFVCYDAETYLLGEPIIFEQILMKAGRKKDEIDEVKTILHKYHLYMTKEEKYPVGKNSVPAGFEYWLLNEKKFEKNKTNGNGKTTDGAGAAKLGTSAARVEALTNWGK